VYQKKEGGRAKTSGLDKVEVVHGGKKKPATAGGVLRIKTEEAASMVPKKQKKVPRKKLKKS